MLIDAHAHMDVPRPGMLTLLCGTEPISAAKVVRLSDKDVLPCCALHPWHAEEHSVLEMLLYIEKCPVLGEIGLDSVWTDADMDAQRKIFHQQLDLAQRLSKPVVLHTKGMEKEIAETLRPYTMRKLVHWYSCEEFLDMYIEQDCWFTVGPDFAVNPAVQQVLRLVPLNRLLTETDGMDAVEWALGKRVSPEEIIRAELRAIAEAKKISAEEAERIVYDNFMSFVYG